MLKKKNKKHVVREKPVQAILLSIVGGAHLKGVFKIAKNKSSISPFLSSNIENVFLLKGEQIPFKQISSICTYLGIITFKNWDSH